jgi:hypothetical protein
MFDARPGLPETLFVQGAWFPEIDSLHPVVFHRLYGRTPRQALAETYTALLAWGKPIYPVLQATGIPALEVADALTAAAEVHYAPGASLFRYGLGALSRADLAQVAARWPGALPKASARHNRLSPFPIGPLLATANGSRGDGGQSAPRQLANRSNLATSVWPPATPKTGSGPGSASLPVLSLVDPDDERSGLFTIGYYSDSATLAAGWTRDRDTAGRARLYREASHNRQTLYVGYLPRLAARGLYTIEVFVPRSHATIRDVHHFIVDYPRGVRRESLAILDQSVHYDVWVPLRAALVNGQPVDPPVTEFALDPVLPDAGRVNVADITFVDPATLPARRAELSVGAVRWRPYTLPAVAAPPPEVAGFDSPVGTPDDRASAFADGRRLFDRYDLWCGSWYDANPIGSRYWLGNRYAIHTGADLNLNGPGGVLADKDAPVYAIGEGRVISAGFVSAGWKNVIIIEHPVPGEDRVIYARYAHVDRMQVRANDLVTRGQQICTIGQYAPNNYHLHFDLSYNPILKTVPGHWPGDNLNLVLQVYVDPKVFIKQRHVIR